MTPPSVYDVSRHHNGTWHSAAKLATWTISIALFGAFCALTAVFIVWWVLIGWGVSIAVRSYRWCMRFQGLADNPVEQQVHQFR
jgi:hypothetical protein